MSLDSELSSGFQVKYLGSVSFTRKKRQPLKGIVSLQRPLLDLYTGARRRGESHRSVHPLALTQQLEICDYGLVVAEGNGETVITKVITPLSNVVLWAAVRFHARIIKKRVFGAAFVPLACSDGVLDHKSYICLASKQRFLVSLTHPSVFACIYRRVSSPTTFECHAFVCATAEDALAIAGLATLASQQSDLPTIQRPLYPRHGPPTASIESGTDYYTPSDVPSGSRDIRGNGLPRATDTEEESNSYASVVNKTSPRVGRFTLGARSPRIAGGRQKKYTHHREARAFIGRCKAPGAPPHIWDGLPSRQRERLDDQQRSTSSYDRDESERAPPPDPRYRDTSTMTEPQSLEEPNLPPPTEVLAETIDLSSESSSSSATSGAGWRPLVPETKEDPPLIKYTYFGYETYARPNVGISEENSSSCSTRRSAFQRPPHVEGRRMGEQRRTKTRRNVETRKSVIKGNGTGKVTINVPYNLRPESRNSSASSRTVPHGVRSFQKNGHVRNWSSLSQTSASSSSSYNRGIATLPAQRVQQTKVIRWSSEDRLPRRHSGGFFWSLKRLSIQSLTKAKHKTGKFLSSVKTRIMGVKKSSADGSEDSAYDTSEVCLSPSGRQRSGSPNRQPTQGSVARRQQSWSFHDLRTTAVERPAIRRNHHPHRRKHRRRRKGDCNTPTSSSDSGVEAAYHSDNSARKSGSDPNGNGVTRVQVQHGMGTSTFHRWSHTNIHDELGYIP
ncbi:hypothetical protein X975_11862, partial [Stegodyphus mimosarum]